MTKNLFNERVGFNEEADLKFEERNTWFDEHFRENEEEDDKVDLADTEVTDAVVRSLNLEIDTFNAELSKKKAKDGGTGLKDGELNELENTTSTQHLNAKK